MASGLDATKTAARPSHEAIESTGGKVDETSQQHLDREAMESAKRAQNRIHSNEQTTPESTIFTK
jgi:methylmalonyl-CoA mutase N-terminal domain/subunit